MAKGARASTKKENNRKLKSHVFGPIESARTARLSAKLLELASQAKPGRPKEDIDMDEERGRQSRFSEVSWLYSILQPADSHMAGAPETKNEDAVADGKQTEGKPLLYHHSSESFLYDTWMTGCTWPGDG